MEEEYTCDSNGQLKVRISDKSNDYMQEFRLGAWSKNGERRGEEEEKRQPFALGKE